MTITKRLLIQGSSIYGSDYSLISVNTQEFTQIDSEIGAFFVNVSIRNFDGSARHRSNSLFNVGDKKYLNGDLFDNDNFQFDNQSPNLRKSPNLRILVKFSPKSPIRGSELLFGNDCTAPIRDYVPTALLATGLKFFSWFVNPTVQGDVYNDSPYLYGLALNSFTNISILSPNCNTDPKVKVVASVPQESLELADQPENLNENVDNVLDIPTNSKDRQKYFCKVSNCESFVFNESATYSFQFDTNFLRMGDSKYHVSIPTYGNRTFDFDVSQYANLNLNNFNWIIKQSGYGGVKQGITGLVLNFSLENEET